MSSTGIPGQQSVTTESRHALVGPADLWEMKRRFQIEFLRRHGLLRGHRLLDLGCGTLRGGIPLIAYLDEGHYTGLEVRPEVLAEGHRELADAGLAGKKPTLLLCNDLAELELPGSFERVWAFAVLIHMSDAVLETALKAVARHLTDDGLFFGNVNIGDDAEGNWQGFPVVCRTWDHYRSAFNRHGLHIEDIGSLAEHGHHHPRLGRERMDRQRMLRGRKLDSTSIVCGKDLPAGQSID